MNNRLDTSRVIRAPHGDKISAKSWQAEQLAIGQVMTKL